MRPRILIILLSAILIWVGTSAAGAAEYTKTVSFDKRNLSGPRFGMTYILGDSELKQELERENVGPVVSQFGWHFERQIIPEGGGPQFVVEFVPMLAAVEYGKFVPNLTLAMGVRMPGGWELGLGPNMLLSKSVEDNVHVRTALVTAIGRSLNYGGVSIPINLAYTSSPEGNRVSLIFGYAIGKTGQEKEKDKKSSNDATHDNRLGADF